MFPRTHTDVLSPAPCLHCAIAGKQEKAMLEWMSRMSQSKERRHGTTTVVGWATFICCLVPGQDGLHCSPGTRGSECSLKVQTWRFSSWKTPRTESFHTTVPVITAAGAGHPHKPSLRALSSAALSPQDPYSPPETSWLSHADEPRDHPCAITDPTHIQT